MGGRVGGRGLDRIMVLPVYPAGRWIPACRLCRAALGESWHSGREKGIPARWGGDHILAVTRQAGGRPSAGAGIGRRRQPATEAAWMLVIALASAVSKSASVCWAVRPSVSARLKLAMMPGFSASLALASSRL